MKSSILLALTAIAAITFGGASNAATVVTPSSAVATSSLAATFNATELINGDGLSGGGDPILDQTHITVTNNNPVGYWLANEVNDPPQQVVFTLAGPTDLNTAYIWQYTRNHNSWNLRGIETLNMAFSTDGGSNYGPPVPVTLTVGQQGVPEDESAQVIPFTLLSGVTHVRFTDMQNFAGGGSFIALAEVRFGNVPIPEPSTSLLALGGMIGLLFSRRRRG